MSFLPLFSSRFEMRSSNSDKKLWLNGSFYWWNTFPADVIPTGYPVFYALQAWRASRDKVCNIIQDFLSTFMLNLVL